MNHAETLRAFAAVFVNEEFRGRFVHEALKKPGKLYERVCHSIDDVFPPQYKNRSIRFEPEARCLVLGLTPGLQETTWGEAHRQMNRGEGLLVIDMAATRFYAETEGAPRSAVWAGER